MTIAGEPVPANSSWLTRYYLVRFLFSALWVVLALVTGSSHPAFSAGLIVAYPAWDSLANLIDAQRSGGFRANPTQAVNAIVSAIVTLAVAIAATRDFHADRPPPSGPIGLLVH